jgi:hypothetical protein
VTWQVIVSHFVGIYALVMVVGDIVDWIGRTRSLSGPAHGISVSCLP